MHSTQRAPDVISDSNLPRWGGGMTIPTTPPQKVPSPRVFPSWTYISWECHLYWASTAARITPWRCCGLGWTCPKASTRKSTPYPPCGYIVFSWKNSSRINHNADKNRAEMAAVVVACCARDEMAIKKRHFPEKGPRHGPETSSNCAGLRRINWHVGKAATKAKISKVCNNFYK